MDTEDSVIEEGELVDDTEEVYNPLPRPENYASAQSDARFPVIDSDESEEEEEESLSESDSDSDGKMRNSKKPKLKVKRSKIVQSQPTKKKYDIWSTRLQEDVLANTLNNCDVTLKDRSRDVETYDYTLGRKYYGSQEKNLNKKKNEACRATNKRSRDDRRNPNLRPNQRSKSKDNDVKGSSRTILSLAVTADSTEEEIAKDIANKLYEDKEDLILRVVSVIGKQKAFELFEETKRIELDGGMLIMNMTRRRTPGGVFLFLLRHDSDLTEEQTKEIFAEEKKQFKEMSKKKQKLKSLKEKAARQVLPELLSRAELCVQKLAADSNRTRKESDHSDVINPPPTPETDGHENSGDGMDNIAHYNINGNDSSNLDKRKMLDYGDDFLDLRGGNEMDLL